MSKRARFDRVFRIDAASGDVQVRGASVFATSPSGAGGAAAAALKQSSTQNQQPQQVPPSQQQQRTQTQIAFLDYVDPATGALAYPALRSALINDSARFVSPSVFATSTLDRVLNETRQQRRPDSASTAAALVVLETLAGHVGAGLEPVVARITELLEESIFQKKSYGEFSTFFDLYRASLDSRLEAARRPQAAVARALQRCCQQTLRAAFVSWRSLTRSALNARFSALRRGRNVTRRNARASLRAHFLAWRDFMKSRCVVLTKHEATTRLVHRLARHLNSVEQQLFRTRKFCEELLRESHLSFEKLSAGHEKWLEFRDWMKDAIEAQKQEEEQAGRGDDAAAALLQIENEKSSAANENDENQSQQRLIEDRRQDEEPRQQQQIENSNEYLLLQQQLDQHQIEREEKQREEEARNAVIADVIQEARRLNDQEGVLADPDGVAAVVSAASNVEMMTSSHSKLLEQTFAAVDGQLQVVDESQQQTPQQNGEHEEQNQHVEAEKMAEAARELAEEQRRHEFNGLEILDWCASRISCVSVARSLSPLLPRPRNLSTDFADGQLLARLAVSLGAPLQLLERFSSLRTISERLTVVCDELNDLLVSLGLNNNHNNTNNSNQQNSSRPFVPADILGLRGRKIGRALFQLYRKFSHLPAHVAPQREGLDLIGSSSGGGGARRRRRQNQDGNSGDDDSMLLLLPSQHQQQEDRHERENRELRQLVVASSEAMRNRTSDYSNADDDEPIDPAQLTRWYSELAAEDSDLDQEVVDEEISGGAEHQRGKSNALAISAVEIVQETFRNSMRKLETLNQNNNDSNGRHDVLFNQKRALVAHRLTTAHQGIMRWAHDRIDSALADARDEVDRLRRREQLSMHSAAHKRNMTASIPTTRPHQHDVDEQAQQRVREQLSTLDVISCMMSSSSQGATRQNLVDRLMFPFVSSSGGDRAGGGNNENSAAPDPDVEAGEAGGGGGGAASSSSTTASTATGGGGATGATGRSLTKRDILHVENMLHASDPRLRNVRLRSAFSVKRDDSVLSVRNLIILLYCLQQKELVVVV